jgi:hypothetical protein
MDNTTEPSPAAPSGQPLPGAPTPHVSQVQAEPPTVLENPPVTPPAPVPPGTPEAGGFRRRPSGKFSMWRNRYGQPRVMAAGLAVALFAVAGGTLASISSAGTVAVSGVIKQANGKCLDNKWGVTSNGNPVGIHSCNNTTAQTWTLPGDDTIRVQGKCLDTYKQSKSSGAAVAIYACNGAITQKWTANSNGTVTNKAVANLCLDNKSNLNKEDNPVQVLTCNGGSAQKWTVPTPASQPAPTPPPPAPAPTPTPPAPAPVPQPTPSPSNPSGQAMPSGDLPGWKQIFADDFTKDAALGSWASDCDGNKIVYTGAQGQQWRAYPKCYKDTYQKRPYRSDQVLSVQNGALNFWLHNVDGIPAGANPSPVIDPTAGDQNQLYGRYTARFKVDTPTLSEYHIAWLLWPKSEVWPQGGEEDYPEGALSDTKIGGFHHYAGAGACTNGCQDAASAVGAYTDWHTYTVEWTPGNVKYILDGTVVLNSSKYVPDGPMRWQLQTETNGSGTHSGNLMVDWVSVYAYSPATAQTTVR